MPNNQPFIWCECCEAIKPLIEAKMFGMDTTRAFTNPTDLMCAECRLVIATTYDKLYAAEHSVQKGKP